MQILLRLKRRESQGGESHFLRLPGNGGPLCKNTGYTPGKSSAYDKTTNCRDVKKSKIKASVLTSPLIPLSDLLGIILEIFNGWISTQKMDTLFHTNGIQPFKNKWITGSPLLHE